MMNFKGSQFEREIILWAGRWYVESINRPGEKSAENETADTSPETLPPDRHPRLWSEFVTVSVLLSVTVASVNVSQSVC